jgi:hypothetical protein
MSKRLEKLTADELMERYDAAGEVAVQAHSMLLALRDKEPGGLRPGLARERRRAVEALRRLEDVALADWWRLEAEVRRRIGPGVRS